MTDPVEMVVVPDAALNKRRAEGLLLETDWTQIPSIADKSINIPYLGNVVEFIPYRQALREIAISPVAGNIDWPVKPSPVWLYE